MVSLHELRRLSEIGVFGDSTLEIPRAGWHLLIIRIPQQTVGWVALVRFKSHSKGALSQEIALVHPLRQKFFGFKLAVAFLRKEACNCNVQLYGLPNIPTTVSIALVRLIRPIAVAGVWLQNPKRFQVAFRAVSGIPIERFRKAIAAAAMRGQEFPKSYREWSRLFDTWSDEQLGTIVRSLSCVPDIVAVVFHSGKGSTRALEATLQSLKNQIYEPVQVIIIEHEGTLIQVKEKYPDGWTAVLQAGEVLPRHALLFLARTIDNDGSLDIVLADEDRLALDGSRIEPLFKPQPSLTMICSGLISRGVWLIRSALLPCNAIWAECVRLQAWFHLHALGLTERVRRTPYILTHRLSDAEQAPTEDLSICVNDYLAVSGVHAKVSTDFPMILNWRVNVTPVCKVSIVVPSRLKGKVQLACMLDVVKRTNYGNFDVFIVVSQEGPLDDEQMEAASNLQSNPRVTVRLMQTSKFNYSTANNFAVAHTSSEFVCLLNDDVSILDENWLGRMIAMFSDANTGIVGAKLYYPNMTVQHGGVIMGLAGLVEHASRFIPRGEPGYAWRAVLDQEFSSVTGACLLVRRSIFEKIGGLDEGLPAGFNDVDFCLRVRRLSYSVVFAASVELVHHETISFGHHYAHNRLQEAADVRIMRERWADVCQSDPFHNPNLSLAGEAEWELAYPPRRGE